MVHCRKNGGAIVAKNLDGVISIWNHPQSGSFAIPPKKPSESLLQPPNRQDEEAAIHARIRRGGRGDPYETVRQHKVGTLADISHRGALGIATGGNCVTPIRFAGRVLPGRRAEILCWGLP